MKKLLLILLFLPMFVAGYSQISKADAQAFLIRNSFSSGFKLYVFNTFGVDNNGAVFRGTNSYDKEKVVSITATDTGFSLSFKFEKGTAEIFYPYSSVAYLNKNDDNTMSIFLRD